MPIQTIERRLDDLIVDLRGGNDLDELIAATESRLRFLNALRGVEPAPPAAAPSHHANGKAPKVKAKAAKATAGHSRKSQVAEREEQVAAFLQGGPRKLKDIERELGIPTSSLHSILAKSPRFQKTGHGEYGLSSTPGQRPKAPPASKPVPAPSTGNLAERLGAFLKANGPRRSDAIRHSLGCSIEQLEVLLEHPWFEKDNGMFTLTTDGHTEFSRGQDD